MGYFQISNQYFPGSLGSRVLVKGNEESGFQVKVTPCYRRSLVYVYFFLAETICWLPMRRIGCLASTVVTWLEKQFLYLENMPWWRSIQTAKFKTEDSWWLFQPFCHPVRNDKWCGVHVLNNCDNNFKVIPQYYSAHPYRARFLAWLARANKSMHVENERDFPQANLDSELNVLF